MNIVTHHHCSSKGNSKASSYTRSNNNSRRHLLYIAIISFSLLLSSCYQRTQYWRAIAYRYSDSSFKYEIQLAYHEYRRGNIHNSSLEKHESEGSDWMYLHSLSGTIGADSIVFTNHQRGITFPWKQSDLKGNLEFVGDTLLLINLQIPDYKDGVHVDHWDPWKYNGSYSLMVKNDTAPLLETHP